MSTHIKRNEIGGWNSFKERRFRNKQVKENTYNFNTNIDIKIYKQMTDKGKTKKYTSKKQCEIKCLQKY